ncbi:MAG: hypothetical protein SGPRY_011231, partial [Prymnesium sp.]
MLQSLERRVRVGSTDGRSSKAHPRRRTLRFSGNSQNSSLGEAFTLDMLTADQLHRIQTAFNRFDEDKSGQISAPEMLQPDARLRVMQCSGWGITRSVLNYSACAHVMRQVLRLLGSNPSQAEFQMILHAIDRNNDGLVDFEEFAQVWYEREKANLEDDFQEELQLAFKIFDADDSGTITAQELRDKLTSLGERMTHA